MSWKFKMLPWQCQWKFQTLLYTLWRLCEEIWKKFVRLVSEKKALKVQILNEVALRQVVSKRVSFQDRRNENAPKFPGVKIWYYTAFWRYLRIIESFITFLLGNLSRLLKIYGLKCIVVWVEFKHTEFFYFLRRLFAKHQTLSS